ncbi:MAG TPA: ATP-binding protein [Jatrophihabitans sp.]|nr:ATP-binding protein [Jatrophihabitans sp.]
MSATTKLPCVPESARVARDWVSAELAGMYASLDTQVDDVSLVVSELVTNCVRTEAHYFALDVDGHRARVTVATTDDAPGMPSPKKASPGDAHGRGLAIVDALADQWGVDRHSHCKTVWADLAVPTSAGPTFDCGE